jgi:hypothetical protein
MEDESAQSAPRVPVGGSDATQQGQPADLQRLLLDVSRLAATRRDLDGLLGELILVLKKAVQFDGLVPRFPRAFWRASYSQSLVPVASPPAQRIPRSTSKHRASIR